MTHAECTKVCFVDGYKSFGGKYCLHHQMVLEFPNQGTELIDYLSDYRLHQEATLHAVR